MDISSTRQPSNVTHVKITVWHAQKVSVLFVWLGIRQLRVNVCYVIMDVSIVMEGFVGHVLMGILLSMVSVLMLVVMFLRLM